jgi:hypothetical protein
MRLHRLVQCAVLCVMLALTSCVPRFTSVGLGRYDEFQPYARSGGRGVDLELARAGHVAVISVILPRPAFADRPVLFAAVYPYYDTDQRYFEAGQHRLLPRRETVRVPLTCGSQQTPTLEGCRRAYDMLPGVRTLSEYITDYGIRGGHYIVFVADEPVDPYTLAEQLFYMAFDRPELTRLLRQLDAPAAAAELENALLDRPGTPRWAALYVAAR